MEVVICCFALPLVFSSAAPALCLLGCGASGKGLLAASRVRRWLVLARPLADFEPVPGAACLPVRLLAPGIS